jgi:hypothetical protein
MTTFYVYFDYIRVQFVFSENVAEKERSHFEILFSIKTFELRPVKEHTGSPGRRSEQFLIQPMCAEHSYFMITLFGLTHLGILAAAKNA